jgi:hypothetical protein
MAVSQACARFQTRRPAPYVGLVGVDLNNGDDYDFRELGDGDILSRDGEGYWNTGLRMTVQGQAGSAAQLMF